MGPEDDSVSRSTIQYGTPVGSTSTHTDGGVTGGAGPKWCVKELPSCLLQHLHFSSPPLSSFLFHFHFFLSISLNSRPFHISFWGFLGNLSLHYPISVGQCPIYTEGNKTSKKTGHVSFYR